MEDPWAISMLSLAMLVGCYIAGSIPLTFNFSERKMRFLTVLGAGLLVGTALAVIIPEGIHALFEGKSDGHIHRAVNAPPPEEDAQVGDVHKDGEHHDHQGVEAHSVEEDLHYLIGVALVSGFVFMLLVDQISGSGGHSHGPPAGDVENSSSRTSRSSMTATVGLVVHAAADGIAMGAAATMSRPDIQMIVFVAIMLHKAPAAFGLVSFLLHENYERNRIRKHLFIFAMAAPVAALITFFGLNHTNKQALSSINATGISMLFSAGTFLYVATVHVLPEISKERHSSTPDSDGNVEIQHGFSRTDLLAVVAGCIAPLFLSIGHHH